MNKNKFSNTQKYWNGTVLQFNHASFKQEIISDLEKSCSYELLTVTNKGKKKITKNLSIQDRDLYTPSMGIKNELPYLKKFTHYVSIKPPGKSYLFYLKNFNNKSQIICINRYKDVNINYEHRMYKINMEFEESLYEGTLFDGQAVKKKDGKWYFVIDDIYMYKGDNIMNNSFDDRQVLLKEIFSNEDFFKIKDDTPIRTYQNNSSNVIYFELKLYVDYRYGIDLAENYYKYFNYFDTNDKFKNNSDEEFNGDIPKGLIFTNKTLNATKIYYILPLQRKKKTLIKTKTLNKFYFIMKKTKVSDVYNLYCMKDKMKIFHCVASINTLRLSQKVKLYFSSVDKGFDIDKDEYLDEEVVVECKFNDFNKWEPINKIIEDITDIKDIKAYEDSNMTKIMEIPPAIERTDYDKNSYLVYNEKNKLVSDDYLNSLLARYDIKHNFKNKFIIQQAFIHKSYSKHYYYKEYNKDKTGKSYIASKVVYNLLSQKKRDNKMKCLELFDESYERLEWLGDAKLEDIISTYLEKRYATEDEGFLTLIRSKLVRKAALSKIGYKLGFSEYVIISKQCEKYDNGRHNIDILEDVFEALIGAFYKEFEEQKCLYKLEKFILGVYEKDVDICSLIEMNDNYKAIIMEYFHKKYNKNPYYREEDTELDKTIFTMNICNPITKQIIGTGTDKIKKKAEQLAAKQALIYLNLL